MTTNLLDELIETFNQTNPGGGSVSSREQLDQLSNLCWRFLLDAPISEPSWLGGANYDSFFEKTDQQRSARVYELLWFAEIKYLLHTEGPSSFWVLALLERLGNEAANPKVPTRSRLFIMGCLNYYLGRYFEAKHYISRAHHENIPDSVVTPFFMYSRSTCLFEEPFIPEQSNTLIDNEFSAPWIVISGDSVYLKKYLPNYVSSISNFGGDCVAGIYVDWMKDDLENEEEILPTIEAVRNAASFKLEFHISPIPQIRDKRSFFGFNRFSIAQQLLPLKGTIVVTDLDYELRSKLSESLAALTNFDVLTLKAGERDFRSVFPWLDCQAGTLVLKNTPAGNAFIRQVNNNIARSFVPSSWNWGIDQNALSTSVHNFRKTARIAGVKEFTNPFYVPRRLKNS